MSHSNAKTPAATARPADLPATAVWPPRATVSGPVTTIDDTVVQASPIPEGGVGVRIGKVPMPAQARDAADRTSELPTEGHGAARSAIPAPESAGTTGTVPPPAVLQVDGGQDARQPAPKAEKKPKARKGRGK